MQKTLITMMLILLGAAARQSLADEFNSRRIQPDTTHPRYWQYHGQAVLLLGGTKDDDLFQIPDLEEHLDLLAKVGGNYIRCVMSGRDKGSVWPFAQAEDGKVDLTRFNEEYWKRFDRMLKLTHERQIIVQVEVWALHDFFSGRWAANPWHPDNNTNYALAQSGLRKAYSGPSKVRHGFFVTVPKLKNNGVVLPHQQRFVDRLLASALPYDHVLYCMTNEIHPLYPPEWGWYWADYIRQQAQKQDKQVETSEMYWQTDLKHKRHRQSIDRTDVFTFFEASQNSAIKGQGNWDHLQHVWRALAKRPRPINHTKIYGADMGQSWAGKDRNATARFWRNMIGGSASSRFHRPDTGMGLSAVAQSHLRSMRMLAAELDLFRCVPDSTSRLLLERNPDEAYLTRIDGEQYALYLPAGGSVQLDLAGVEGAFSLRWLDISHSRWLAPQAIQAGQKVQVTTPGKGHWAAVIKAPGSSKTRKPR
ncbi:MAG: hypothetical protein HN849_26505 [Victivallales bacterium]|nr:hypothetical protein [Victivallales bacterium]